MMLIRVEIPVDAAAIDVLLSDTFPRSGEAALLRRLREDGLLTLGLVAAEDDGHPVGYLACSPVTFAGEDRQWVAIAVLAVLESQRNCGIARQLIEESFNILHEFGYRAVLVTGARDFYQRFGFQPASDYGLHCQQLNSTNTLQVRALAEDALANVQGTIDYPAWFAHL